MTRRATKSVTIKRFFTDDCGAALVEFALILPMMLLCLALCFEGARTLWAYQATIAGVRDASRYLSRVVDADICAKTTSVASWDAALREIVISARDGGTVFPGGVDVSAVYGSLTCLSGYRTLTSGGKAAVITVTANLNIDYPFAGIFALVGVDLERVETSVRDQARVIGL
jgi:hypothetical protein